MSATGRGSDRVDNDFYPTPSWCTRRIIEALPSELVHVCGWCEPCAGDGAITRIIEEAGVYPGKICGGDLRQIDRPSSIQGGWFPGESFTQWDTRFDVVITNPPFALAPELIEHFLPRCDWLVLLLRSSFKLVHSGNANRKSYSYRDNMPDEYKLPQRPEFVASEKCGGESPGKLDRLAKCNWSRKASLAEAPLRVCPGCGGKVQRSTTDASEYSWFVWTPERGRRHGKVCVLPDTSYEERRASRAA